MKGIYFFINQVLKSYLEEEKIKIINIWQDHCQMKNDKQVISKCLIL